jgi:AbrB family looped-hinge helix DNA binding protein
LANAIVFCHFRGEAMQLCVGKFGRVVLPKAIRDELGLVPGDPLQVKRTEQGIELSPVLEKSVLIKKDGVLVHTGTAVGDMEGTVRKIRETHMAQFLAMETTA